MSLFRRSDRKAAHERDEREGEKTLIGSNDEKNYSKKTSMACSRFEYVKRFERDDRLLPGCWIVLRIDGRGFTK